MSIKNTTQDHLDIQDIKDNYVVLKSGSICSVLKTTAVNFQLLSEVEQDAIIAAFSMLLNSITFTIQVVIRSKRLDITKYLEKVVRTEQKITSPLLKQQAQAYRKFVQELIKKNEVLDKTFYIVVPSGTDRALDITSGPFGFLTKLFIPKTKKIDIDTIKAIETGRVEVVPKVDHLIKEFSRIGIRATSLTTQELVELYFDMYNPVSVHGQRIRTNVNDYKTAIVEPAILE